MWCGVQVSAAGTVRGEVKEDGRIKVLTKKQVRPTTSTIQPLHTIQIRSAIAASLASAGPAVSVTVEQPGGFITPLSCSRRIMR